MLPERERFEQWRETFSLKAVRVDVAVPDPLTFRAATRAQTLEQLALVLSEYSPLRVMRTPSLVRDGNDHLHLVIASSGSVDMHYGEHAIKLGTGAAAVVPANVIGSMGSDADGTALSLVIPRNALPEILGRAELPILRSVPASHPALKLLSIYGRGLLADGGLEDAGMARLADLQMRELVAHLFNPAAELARAQAGAGIQAARLQAIKADILANLAREDLSVPAIAARHRLQVRYVQRLFESEGTTFTEFVLRERLARAYRMLANSRLANLKISAVAMEVGFSNLSHFNHSFRRRFGASPSDVRDQALRSK
jgi:AraC-like DNA-binding protein